MDKKARYQLVSILVLLFLFAVLVVNSTDYSDRTPEDGVYDFDGNDITFNITVTPTAGQNISNISLYVNASTNWIINQTYVYSGAGLTDTVRIVGFILSTLGANSSIPDGTNLIWAVYVGLNGSNSTSSFTYSANRTVNIEYPPKVTLMSPATNFIDRRDQTVINFSVNSSFTSNTNFNCQLMTNESGSWGVARNIAAVNGSFTSFNYPFDNGKADIRWGMRCFENTDGNVFNSSINFTVGADRTIPSVSITSPTSGSYRNAFPFNVSYSLTELNGGACLLYLNGTGSVEANATDLDRTGNFSISSNLPEGVYNARVNCNDTAGNWGNSTNLTFIFDSGQPQITNIGNFSVSGFNDKRKFNFSTNEAVNITIYYGQTPSSLESTYRNGSFVSSPSIDFGGFEENMTYHFNITACDVAGNCNNTAMAFKANFTFPWKLYGAGWSYYKIYDANISFETILNETEAEYVYFWNATGQHWVSATAGGTANKGFSVGTLRGERALGGRHVVAIYEETNSTWARNTTVATPGFFNQNLTVGDNFVGLPKAYTFGNFSKSFFNESVFDSTSGNKTNITGYEWGVTESSTPQGKKYNLTDIWYSAYNNTANAWTLNFIYNFTLENSTYISIPSRHEVMWVYVEDTNITWNGTHVNGNWTY